MIEGESKKKLTLKKAVFLLVGAVLFGVGGWLVYGEIVSKTNPVSPSVKEANDFWNNAYKEMEK